MAGPKQKPLTGPAGMDNGNAPILLIGESRSNDMSLSDASLSADALDHLAPPTSPDAAERRGLVFAVIAAALLHLLIPLGFLLFYWLAAPPAPPVQEIPIEVVVEKPPPPPKPEEKPKPPPMPDDERPAYDAPSAATQEKANRESPDQKTTAPIPKPEPSPQNAGAPEPSRQPPAAQEKKAESAPPTEMKPVQEAEQPSAPSPAPTDADANSPSDKIEPKPSPPPAPPPAPPAKAPPGVPPPTADELPTYQFAHAAMASPVVGGNADTRYFTIVYGMIRNHLHRPPSASAPPHGGAIVFTVDESGNLVQHRVVSPSGSPNLDIAVMNAIVEASPYPAPPGWQPRSMRLVYGR